MGCEGGSQERGRWRVSDFGIPVSPAWLRWERLQERRTDVSWGVKANNICSQLSSLCTWAFGCLASASGIEECLHSREVGSKVIVEICH